MTGSYQPYLGVPHTVPATGVVPARLEEWRQLPGGDLLAGTQAAVLRHQGGGEESSRKDDDVGTCLDGAVIHPTVVEGEALPALSPLPGEQLSGRGGVISPHEEETLAGDCRGVVYPAVQGLPPQVPAGRGELVTGECDHVIYGLGDPSRGTVNY